MLENTFYGTTKPPPPNCHIVVVVVVVVVVVAVAAVVVVVVVVYLRLCPRQDTNSVFYSYCHNLPDARFPEKP